MRLNKAKAPLGLPFRMPRCWSSQEAWRQYRKDAQYTATDYFTYCTDCTAAHQAEMKAAGRCAHPEFKTDKKTWRTGRKRRVIH